jgi:hypothetical protein
MEDTFCLSLVQQVAFTKHDSLTGQKVALS